MFKKQGRAEKNNTKEVRNKGRKPRKDGRKDEVRDGRKEAASRRRKEGRGEDEIIWR